ncbi:hypothetical protein [Bacillus toyonensis]|uniref:hypothetical protein n=1 Tax=Bacillus toyonensis TaxID=155322 RepID=UPI000BF9374E|nr:hypothetical protein [Bacillus toyonensis]PGF05035.1 hypothetical protein COM61_00955 [Bacillus toyonensis]
MFIENIVLKKLFDTKRELEKKYPYIQLVLATKEKSYWETAEGVIVAIDSKTNIEVPTDKLKYELFVISQGRREKILVDNFKAYDCVQRLLETDIYSVCNHLMFENLVAMSKYMQTEKVTRLLHDICLNPVQCKDLENHLKQLVFALELEVDKKLNQNNYLEAIEIVQCNLNLIGELSKHVSDVLIKDVLDYAKQALRELEKENEFIKTVELANSICLYLKKVDEKRGIEDSKYENYKGVQYVEED